MLQRKEVRMEPPQYNGGLFGLRRRGYLATVRTLQKVAILKRNQSRGSISFIIGPLSFLFS